jgi:dienelactone hydrolase
MGIFGAHPARSPFTTAVPAGAVPVSLLTSDGVSLAGWYTPAENRAAVVLLHGAGGTKADTRAQAAELAAAGYGVLAIDARGGGESAGRGMLWGWHGDLDVGAAVAWLASRPEIDPARIGAVGLSMGGEQAITAAATNPGIHAVVAEGASARTPDDAVALLNDDLSGAIQRVFYPVMWAAADAFTNAAPPIPLADAVRALGERELLLISSDDPNDKAAGPLLRDADPSSVTLWEPSNGHTQALAVHPDEWRTRVVSFLDRTLAP